MHRVLTDLLLVSVGGIWLSLLFGAALLGERYPHLLERRWGSVYALSLAVYCTSWTFYGTVTQAARSGWWLPPTFIGTILLFVFGIGLLLKLVRLAQAHRATSLADLIATRLGNSSALAAGVTLIAVLGVLPYIALQLKAVAMSFSLLTLAATNERPAWQDSALYVALAMALFAMLFGTRSANAAEHNRGLVLAMAVESLLKLGAMAILGVFVWSRFDLSLPMPAVPEGAAGFPSLILLGVLAMFTLPHQFHVGVVECRDPRHLATARWLFPLYMVLIGIPILPVAMAGMQVLAPLGVPSDLFVLALPLSVGAESVAVLAFLGGLSAATGMVILATLALSLMIGNHLIAPLLLRGPWAARDGRSLRGSVLLQRRVIILAVILLAWTYSRTLAGSEALADIGALSFSAVATIAPALGFAVWAPRIPPRAVLAGLLFGFALWCWILLLPILIDAFDWQGVLSGPSWSYLSWLLPDQFLGLSGWSRTTRAVVVSLFGATTLTLVWALRRPSTSIRRPTGLDYGTLRDVASRFLPQSRVAEMIPQAPRDRLAPSELEAAIEGELATVLGAASARLLLDAARRAHGHDLEAVAAIVGEASQALRFNQRVLEAALENMGQGISVVDRELSLVAWNQRYQDLFAYPDHLLQIGVPVQQLLRYNLQKSGGSLGDIEFEVQRRLRHMRAGTPYVTERLFRDGMTVEIRGNPMPGGGFVATFTDVTAFRHAEAELKRANETLELRVRARTAEFESARAEAERANHAKTRWLAAVSHDLAQPLNAAHLFAHALAQRMQHDEYRQSLADISASLDAAESLLAGLLDISRLDSGGLSPQIEAFPLDPLLQALGNEFRLLAEAKGLRFHAARTGLWVRSDAQLLRRVLQNFLANAVRYTPRGGVLLGCRRQGEQVRIEVWDTGLGIRERDQGVIFEEFRRLDRGGQGLGLGLAISDRIAKLLKHPIGLRSQFGRGSVFSLALPRAQAKAVTVPPIQVESVDAQGKRVLVMDNDAAVLAGMRELLRGWQCEVVAARNEQEVLAALAEVRPALMLFDFHLDDGDTGLALRERLPVSAHDIPCVIITADHSEAVRNAVRDSGAWLLHKPLKPIALRALMTRLLD